MMIICTKCSSAKETGEFPKDRNRGNGHSVWCRSCHREYRRENRLRNSEYGKQYRKENSELCRRLTANWFESNPAYRKQHAKRYREQKPHVQVALNAQYRAAKKQATPSWADREKIKVIYEEAAALTKKTGIVHHVDHIYPLQSDWCCGLHVEANLQILIAHQNQSKGNRLAEGPCP